MWCLALASARLSHALVRQEGWSAPDASDAQQVGWDGAWSYACGGTCVELLTPDLEALQCCLEAPGSPEELEALVGEDAVELRASASCDAPCSFAVQPKAPAAHRSAQPQDFPGSEVIDGLLGDTRSAVEPLSTRHQPLERQTSKRKPKETVIQPCDPFSTFIQFSRMCHFRDEEITDSCDLSIPDGFSNTLVDGVVTDETLNLPKAAFFKDTIRPRRKGLLFGDRILQMVPVDSMRGLVNVTYRRKVSPKYFITWGGGTSHYHNENYDKSIRCRNYATPWTTRPGAAGIVQWIDPVRESDPSGAFAFGSYECRRMLHWLGVSDPGSGERRAVQEARVDHARTEAELIRLLETAGTLEDGTEAPVAILSVRGHGEPHKMTIAPGVVLSSNVAPAVRAALESVPAQLIPCDDTDLACGVSCGCVVMDACYAAEGSTVASVSDQDGDAVAPWLHRFGDFGQLVHWVLNAGTSSYLDTERSIRRGLAQEFSASVFAHTKVQASAVAYSASEFGWSHETFLNGKAFTLSKLLHYLDEKTLDVPFFGRVVLGSDADQEAFTRELHAEMQRSNMQVLDLRGHYIGDYGMELLSRSLRAETVTTLDIGQANVGDEGLSALASWLPDSNVKTLWAPGNAFASLTDFAAALPSTPVVWLDLGDNRLGDPAAHALAARLKASKVNDLRLANIGMTEEGALSLADGLVGSQVKYLSVQGNEIGPQGAQAFAAALFDTMLQGINLADNSIGEVGAAALANALVRSRATPTESSFEELNAAMNALGPRGVQRLAAAVADDVQRLELGFNGCGDEGVKAVVNALARRAGFDLDAYGARVSAVVNPLHGGDGGEDLERTASHPPPSLTRAARSRTVPQGLGDPSFQLRAVKRNSALSLSERNAGELAARSVDEHRDGAGTVPSSFGAVERARPRSQDIRRILASTIKARDRLKRRLFARKARVPPRSQLALLGLQSNRVTDAGAKLLAAVLRRSHLQVVDLRHNKLTARGARKLGDGLVGSRVKTLNLLGNHVASPLGRTITRWKTGVWPEKSTPISDMCEDLQMAHPHVEILC